MPSVRTIAVASSMGTVETGTFILAAIIIGCATAAVLFSCGGKGQYLK